MEIGVLSAQLSTLESQLARLLDLNLRLIALDRNSPDSLSLSMELMSFRLQVRQQIRELSRTLPPFQPKGAA
jgi:hypothetical protein